jgi:hypothetical protein
LMVLHERWPSWSTVVGVKKINIALSTRGLVMRDAKRQSSESVSGKRRCECEL